VILRYLDEVIEGRRSRRAKPVGTWPWNLLIATWRAVYMAGNLFGHETKKPDQRETASRKIAHHPTGDIDSFLWLPQPTK